MQKNSLYARETFPYSFFARTSPTLSKHVPENLWPTVMSACTKIVVATKNLSEALCKFFL